MFIFLLCVGIFFFNWALNYYFYFWSASTICSIFFSFVFLSGSEHKFQWSKWKITWKEEQIAMNLVEMMNYITWNFLTCYQNSWNIYLFYKNNINNISDLLYTRIRSLKKCYSPYISFNLKFHENNRTMKNKHLYTYCKHEVISEHKQNI